MLYIKDEGIVLQLVKVADKDLSITVYFKSLGKENIYLKGGQIIKNPLLPVVQPFNWFKGVIIKYKEKLFIKEVDKSYLMSINISKNLDLYYKGFFILSVFNKYTTFPDKKMFNFFKKTVYFLSQAKDSDLFVVSFLIKYIYLHGILPSFFKCVKCGVKVNRSNFGCFLFKNKGSLCKSCCKKSLRTQLSYEDILLLNKLLRLKYSKIIHLELKGRDITYIKEKLNEYLKDYFN